MITDAGKFIPVTLIQFPSNVVVRVRQDISAVIVGLPSTKKRDENRAKFLRMKQFQVEDLAQFEKNQAIPSTVFEDGAAIVIVGTSKGKGFQGVIKRHNFSRGPMSHGSHQHREPGSIGTRKPRRVNKGKKLPGHMGSEQVTIRTSVAGVDTPNNVIAVKGAVPGHINAFVVVEKRA